MDMDKLYDDLLNKFMWYQYRIENPMPTSEETEENIVIKYRTDPIFNSKVRSLACGVIQIIDKHIEK